MAARFAGLDYKGGNIFEDVPPVIGRTAISMPLRVQAGRRAIQTALSGRTNQSAEPKSCGW